MIDTSEIIIDYQPRGSARDIFKMRDPEIIISGPAGTGKSRSILEKLHLIALKYPNARLLMLRKTRRSLTESGMVTYWTKIRPDLDGVQWKPSMQQYQYPNGAIIAVGGLDRPSKIMSSEWDVIYCQEATELSEEDWEACTIRLRNNKLPYQSLLGDCNPDAPTHWIRSRVQAGKTIMLESRHNDNPLLFDDQDNITAEGKRYLDTLESLSGVRLARYRYGLWASSEGMVYQNEWSRANNLIDRFPIPRSWARYLSIDMGYTNPFVCQWWAQDEDSRLYRYREIYKTQTLVEDHAKQIALSSGWFHLLPKNHPNHKDRPAENADPLPHAIIVDHDPEDYRTLERYLGLYTTPAKKSVSDGIQAVATRLRPAGDNKPRLFFLRDSLVERDQELAARKKPTCFEEEIESYIFKQGSDGSKEEPVKENDHACLVAGTLITTNHGNVPIEQVQTGDYVLTRSGYRRVKASGMTAKKAEVYTMLLSDGRTLTGTRNHPIYLNKCKYIPLHEIRYGDIIEDIKPYFEQYTERYPLCQESLQQNQKLLYSRALSLGAIQSLKTCATETTIALTSIIFKRVLKPFMSKFGKMPTDQYQRDMRYITKMATLLTTRWTILSVLRPKNIQDIMLRTCQRNVCRRLENTLTLFDIWRQHGISQMRVERGIVSLQKCPMITRNIEHIPANNVAEIFSHEYWIQHVLNFALTTVNLHIAVNQAWIMKHDNVSNAEMISLPTVTAKKSIVRRSVSLKQGSLELQKKLGYVQYAPEHLQQKSVVSKNTVQEPAQAVVVSSIRKNNDLQDVYNLTVETDTVSEGEYFANGILVHNCDATRYMVAHMDLVPNSVSYLKGGLWK